LAAARMLICDCRLQTAKCKLQIVVMAVLSFLAMSRDLMAQESQTESAAATDSQDFASDASKIEEQSRKKKRVSAGLLTVALVTVTGLALLAFTVLGGTATRRTLRRPDDEAELRGARPVVGDEVSRREEAGESTESTPGDAESDSPAETRTPDETQE
jgi:hypothetical protein